MHKPYQRIAALLSDARSRWSSNNAGIHDDRDAGLRRTQWHGDHAVSG